jgi:hypothetical protein
MVLNGTRCGYSPTHAPTVYAATAIERTHYPSSPTDEVIKRKYRGMVCTIPELSLYDCASSNDDATPTKKSNDTTRTMTIFQLMVENTTKVNISDRVLRSAKRKRQH